MDIRNQIIIGMVFIVATIISFIGTTINKGTKNVVG